MAHISILWDRVQGLKARGKVQGVIMDPMEAKLALFEIRKALEDALEDLSEGNIAYIWLDSSGKEPEK